MDDQERKPRASRPSFAELEGVREDPAFADPRASTRTRDLALRGQVAYTCTIASPEIPAGAGGLGERRLGNRRELRLRSGKLLDMRRQFLCECLVRDRSLTGLRLTLGQERRVPKELLFFDDETHGLLRLKVVWRRRTMVGAQIVRDPSDPAIESQVRATMRGKFYAIRD